MMNDGFFEDGATRVDQEDDNVAARDVDEVESDGAERVPTVTPATVTLKRVPPVAAVCGFKVQPHVPEEGMAELPAAFMTLPLNVCALAKAATNNKSLHFYKHSTKKGEKATKTSRNDSAPVVQQRPERKKPSFTVPWNGKRRISSSL